MRQQLRNRPEPVPAVLPVYPSLLNSRLVAYFMVSAHYAPAVERLLSGVRTKVKLKA